MSAILSDAVRDPTAVGLNVTVIVQFPPPATLDPQLLVSAKSPGSAPMIVMLVMLSGALPELLNVTFCGALVVPTF